MAATRAPPSTRTSSSSTTRPTSPSTSRAGRSSNAPPATTSAIRTHSPALSPRRARSSSPAQLVGPVTRSPTPTTQPPNSTSAPRARSQCCSTRTETRLISSAGATHPVRKGRLPAAPRPAPLSSASPSVSTPTTTPRTSRLPPRPRAAPVGPLLTLPRPSRSRARTPSPRARSPRSPRSRAAATPLRLKGRTSPLAAWLPRFTHLTAASAASTSRLQERVVRRSRKATPLTASSFTWAASQRVRTRKSVTSSKLRVPQTNTQQLGKSKRKRSPTACRRPSFATRSGR